MRNAVPVALAALLSLGAASCPPSVPVPTPSPTASPTPEPTPVPSPTPTPIPGCGLPPQETFDTCDGQADSPTRVSETMAAERLVMDANPQRVEIDQNNDLNRWLLREDGGRARHEEPGSHEARVWFYDQTVLEVQAQGLCAGRFGTDEVAICAPGSSGPCAALSLINHGSGQIRHAPPGFNGFVCSSAPAQPNPSTPPTPENPPDPTPQPTTDPSSPPAAACPLELGAGKLECRVHNRPAPDVVVADCTLKVCDRDYCQSVGNPNVCCSPGGGDGQWAECEAQLYGIAGDGEPGPDWATTGGVLFVARRGLTTAKFKVQGPGTIKACVPSKPGLCSEFAP